MKNIVILAAVHLTFLCQTAIAQDDYKTGQVDTLKYNSMLLLFSEGFCLSPTYSGLDIISDNDTLVHLAECAIYIYDFCRDTLATNPDCVLRDINGDGMPEIFTNEYWGGNKCCSQFRIYSLHKPIKILANIVPTIYQLYMDDIDADSIAEVIQTDAHWRFWKTNNEFESPGIRIIWKWDGDSMRVANYKFADSISTDSETDPIIHYLKTEMADSGLAYISEDKFPSYPPPEFWMVLVHFAYGGKLDRIEALFEELWPDYNLGRDEFYRDFMEHLEKDSIWPLVKNSNW